MNNTKTQILADKSTMSEFTSLSSTYLSSDSYLHFYRSGHIVTCKIWFTGGGGAFSLDSNGSPKFYTVSTENIPEMYRPPEQITKVIMDTSRYLTIKAPLAVVRLADTGEVLMELINKDSFNIYCTFSYYVD